MGDQTVGQQELKQELRDYGDEKSALEALKTLADRRGLQLRCEEERVSEQEWRACFVVTTVSGRAMEFPWSGVCLGRKRAEEAAAEVTLLCIQECIVPPQQIYTPGGEGGGGGGFEELEPRETCEL
jgi:hypothetical protein